MKADKIHELLDSVSDIKDDYFCHDEKKEEEEISLLEKTEYKNIYKFIMPEYKIVFYDDIKFPLRTRGKFGLIFNKIVYQCHFEIDHIGTYIFYPGIDANNKRDRYVRCDATESEFYRAVEEVVESLRCNIFEQLINQS